MRGFLNVIPPHIFMILVNLNYYIVILLFSSISKIVFL